MNHLSLFTGIGGIDLAAEWVGIKTVCFCEIDEFCQKVLHKHWPEVPIIKDVRDVTKEKVDSITGHQPINLITGGDPCQPRSIAGKRRGKADDRDLWEDMFRVISEFKPNWVINENPTGRLTMDFHEVLSNLESIGYETRSFVIPACAVNANHRRERLFIIANCKGFYGKMCYKIRGGKNNKLGRYIESYANSGSIRTIHGIPTEMDRNRLTALGNAVVPQQIYPILKAIYDIDNVATKDVATQ